MILTVMPVTTSAKKALRVATRRAAENKRVRSRMKAAIKAKDASAQSLIDRAVKAHIIHRNKAARLISRLPATK